MEWHNTYSVTSTTAQDKRSLSFSSPLSRESHPKIGHFCDFYFSLLVGASAETIDVFHVNAFFVGSGRETSN
jgi:hypothetical protein